MRHNKLSLYIHLVWSTWNRASLITPSIEGPMYRCIIQEAQRSHCKVLAINGIGDHVHVLLTLPSTITIAVLVQQIKGVSSRFVNDQLQPEYVFKWQGTYGAFSVSPQNVSSVSEYIAHQKQHHREGFILADFEVEDA